MINVYQKHKSRIDKAYNNIKNAYLHNNGNELPFIIMDVNVSPCGQPTELIPENYFSDIQVMFDYQVNKIQRHMSEILDDYIPTLFPWFGTGVVPSALGCRIEFPYKMDPVVASHVIDSPEDVRKLELPDPYKDGQMPQVLKCIDYMHANSDIPVSVTDCQGPLNIALSLCGVERLFLWMYDYPEYVHELMDFCTEALIQWVRVQKRHAGQGMESGAFPHCIVLPEGFGGVNISDDDCTVLSPSLYKEFVVPYNSRVLKAFGGGTLHFCGNAEHQLDNFLETEGLTGINNFCMHNFGQIVRMQEMFENKLALMVCDFNPLYIEEYYSGLFRDLKFKGTILATFIAPEMALHNGKYEYVSRDEAQIIKQSENAISDLIKEKSLKRVVL